MTPMVRRGGSRIYDASSFHPHPLSPPLRFLLAHSPGVAFLESLQRYIPPLLVSSGSRVGIMKYHSSCPSRAGWISSSSLPQVVSQRCLYVVVGHLRESFYVFKGPVYPTQKASQSSNCQCTSVPIFYLLCIPFSTTVPHRPASAPALPPNHLQSYPYPEKHSLTIQGPPFEPKMPFQDVAAMHLQHSALI